MKKELGYQSNPFQNRRDALGETFFPPVERGQSIEKGPELPAAPLGEIEQPEQPTTPAETTPTELPPTTPEVPAEKPIVEAPAEQASPKEIIEEGLKTDDPSKAVEYLNQAQEQAEQGGKHE